MRFVRDGEIVIVNMKGAHFVGVTLVDYRSSTITINGQDYYVNLYETGQLFNEYLIEAPEILKIMFRGSNGN